MKERNEYLILGLLFLILAVHTTDFWAWSFAIFAAGVNLAGTIWLMLSEFRLWFKTRRRMTKE